MFRQFLTLQHNTVKIHSFVLLYQSYIILPPILVNFKVNICKYIPFFRLYKSNARIPIRAESKKVLL